MKYRINGKLYNPIKMGDPDDWYEYETDPNTTCGDCGVMLGEQHLGGCDIERCPACHGQLISCECHAIEEGGEING